MIHEKSIKLIFSNESLFSMIHEKRTKPVFDVKSLLMRELAMRLTYLHGQEIIHLNRGSRNILLTQVLELKLADFAVQGR